MPWLVNDDIGVLPLLSLRVRLRVLGHSIRSRMDDHVIRNIVLVVDVHNINGGSIFARRALV